MLWLTVLSLDQRLSRLVAQAREPLLVQMRLAWWRDRLREPPQSFHSGEPVLQALSAWNDRERAQLVALVDGWEALLEEPPIADAALMAFANGRGAALAALARQLGADAAEAEARRCGAGWALAELAQHLSDPAERAQVARLIAAHDWGKPRLPRELRPLAVLDGLARRGKGQKLLLAGLSDVVVAARLGLLGA